MEFISGLVNIIFSFLNQFYGERTKSCIIQYFHPISLLVGFHFVALQTTFVIANQIRKHKYLKQLQLFPKQVVLKYKKYASVYPQVNQFKYNKFQNPDISKQSLDFCIQQTKITNQNILFKDQLYQYKNKQLILIKNNQDQSQFEPLQTYVYKQSNDENDYFEKYLQIARLFVFAYCKPKVMFIIEVPRIAVLISVARKLQNTPIENHCYQIYCKFQGEKGADLSGLTKEMFSIMDKELFELTEQDIKQIKNQKIKIRQQNQLGSQIPSYQKISSLSISENNSIMISQNIHPQYAYTMGWYFGKSLFQNITINSNVSNLLILLSMNAPITIDDVMEYDEYFGRFLKKAQEDKEMLDQLIELLPELNYKPITVQNKDNQRQTLYMFSVRQAVELRYFNNNIIPLVKLRQGFDSVFPRENIYFLNPQFVCKKLKSESIIDIDDWEKYTIVHTFPPGCIVVENFWQLMHEDQQLAQNVLQFTTGLKYPPYGGFKTLGEPGIQIIQAFNIQPINPDYLPNSQTCTNTLRLPCINDKQELKRRLLNSIQYQSIENP